MPRKLIVLVVLVVVIVLLLSACDGDDDEKKTPTPVPSPTAQAEGKTLVIADISSDPTDVFPVFQPLADYLAANLAELGVAAVEIKVAPDIATMADWMKNGEVDLYFDSLYPAMLVIDESGAKPILRRWRGGTGEYHTVFYTTADSEVQSLEDLKGKKIVFEEEFSTSGFMLPMAYLVEAGLKPVLLAGPDDPVGADEVGYVFALEDSNIVEWVTRGRVDAGVNDNQKYPEFAAASPVELRILLETEDVPRQLAVVNGALDPALIEAIKALLIGLDDVPDNAPILEALKTSQFDDFPEGIDAALARMQELYNSVQNR
jgi:phosphonate transport system substrate-binding protein